MREFKGVYRGFTPTDESNIGLGEIEISITDELVKFRIATGLKVVEEEFRIEDFRSLTEEEIKASWTKGTPDEVKSSATMFKHISGLPGFMFVKDLNTEDLSLVVQMGMGDMLGPTVLLGPAQVERGEFEKAVSVIEQEAGAGILPRLRNNGKAERE